MLAGLLAPLGALQAARGCAPKLLGDIARLAEAAPVCEAVRRWVGARRKQAVRGQAVAFAIAEFFQRGGSTG
jgi:hypothetical protein